MALLYNSLSIIYIHTIPSICSHGYIKQSVVSSIHICTYRSKQGIAHHCQSRSQPSRARNFSIIFSTF
jgi:hypothetical protein